MSETFVGTIEDSVYFELSENNVPIAVVGFRISTIQPFSNGSSRRKQVLYNVCNDAIEIEYVLYAKRSKRTNCSRSNFLDGDFFAKLGNEGFNSCSSGPTVVTILLYRKPLLLSMPNVMRVE